MVPPSALDANPSLDFQRYVDSRTGAVLALTVAGDDFANQTCMHVAIQQILEKGKPGWDNVVRQRAAFYCQGAGINITEYADMRDLHKFLGETPSALIDEAFVDDLMQQILTPLAALKAQEYSFSHSDLKARNIFVASRDAGVTYRLADFDKSSITWHGFRFYNKWRGVYSLRWETYPPPLDTEGTYTLSAWGTHKFLQLRTMHSLTGSIHPLTFTRWCFP